MIVCTHCQAKNSIDSAFCKSCGREVVEADREVARQENSKLIAEGYTLLAEGRTEEAELVARAALEADEKAAGAHSLLGMCYERADDIVAALDCYERVVDLNPDSALDKIKVTQLRNQLARRVDEEPAPNRKVALAGALACVILVGTIGAITAVLTRPVDAQASVKDEKPNLVASKDAQGFGKIPDPLQNVPQGTQFNNQQVDPNSQTQDPVNAGTGGDANRYGNFPRLGTGRAANDGNGLSNVEQGAEVEDPGLRPMPIELTPRGNEDPRPSDGGNTGAGNTGSGQKSTTDDPGPVGDGGEKPISPAKANGSISITPSGNRPKNNGGGGQSIGDDNEGNGLQTLVRTANQQMLTGNYDGAARALEQARSKGGDSGSVNKKLGMCYEKMGKKGEAIQAYRSAKKQLEAKAGADPTAKSQLESVNQALKNLGG